MIPKIIHYCWFGKCPKSENVKECIESWKRHCPDYEIIEWNESNFQYDIYPYSREAYHTKKYSFVSDLCRLYALYTKGGIYLDVDVRLQKPLDPFLHHSSFIGKESPFMVSTAVIGAEKNSQWVYDFMETYSNRHFISITGRELTKTNVVSLTNFLNITFPQYHNTIDVYDVDWFCANIYYRKGEYYITENTIAIHEFSGSWKKKENGYLQRISNLLFRLFH